MVDDAFMKKKILVFYHLFVITILRSNLTEIVKANGLLFVVDVDTTMYFFCTLVKLLFFVVMYLCVFQPNFILFLVRWLTMIL